MRSYTQTFVVTFKSEAAAQQARLQIAPLYHDLRLGFSTRMDDCDLNNLRVAEVMAKYGQKGTFTLNDPNSWWQDSTATGITMPSEPEATVPQRHLAVIGKRDLNGTPVNPAAAIVIQRLLAGGNSIGDHTLTHEMLPALTKNDAFREIMGDRVVLESQTATPVISFVYPFVYFKSELRDGVDRADLEEMLRRTGIYQLSENNYNTDWDSGMQDSRWIILDGETRNYSDAVLTQTRCEEDRPLFLVTMHAWVKQWGGPEYPKLAAIYRKWAGRKDWWYCNVNQYAAYRYQALHSRLATFVEGNTLKAVLTRPDPLDLGDWVPLTFKVEGVSKDDVVSVKCSDADVKTVPLDGSYAFDLDHSREHGPIKVYAESDNPGNADQFNESKGGTEGLRALLFRQDRFLTLLLRNDSAHALRDIQVVFRLPLRWEEGVVRKQVGSLAGGAAVSMQVPLTERASVAHYITGQELDVAQVDFLGPRRARLYATCETPDGEPAAFFARNGFWVLGPLPGDMADFNPDTFAKPFLDGKPPEHEYTVPWGSSIHWHILPPAKAAILDPDIIPTSGKANIPENYSFDPSVYFPHANVHYLLYGQIVSPQDRIVRAVFPRDCVKRLALNGRIVEGDELTLKQGENDVRILYAPASSINGFNEPNYGCYFRLTDAGENRVTDVRFERPPAP